MFASTTTTPSDSKSWKTGLMTQAERTDLAGSSGNLAVYRWPNDRPHWSAVLVHGYGEYLGRYDHVADRLIGAGATASGF